MKRLVAPAMVLTLAATGCWGGDPSDRSESRPDPSIVPTDSGRMIAFEPQPDTQSTHVGALGNDVLVVEATSNNITVTRFSGLTPMEQASLTPDQRLDGGLSIRWEFDHMTVFSRHCPGRILPNDHEPICEDVDTGEYLAFERLRFRVDIDPLSITPVEPTYAPSGAAPAPREMRPAGRRLFVVLTDRLGEYGGNRILIKTEEGEFESLPFPEEAIDFTACGLSDGTILGFTDHGQYHLDERPPGAPWPKWFYLAPGQTTWRRPPIEIPNPAADPAVAWQCVETSIFVSNLRLDEPVSEYDVQSWTRTPHTIERDPADSEREPIVILSPKGLHTSYGALLEVTTHSPPHMSVNTEAPERFTSNFTYVLRPGEAPIGPLTPPDGAYEAPRALTDDLTTIVWAKKSDHGSHQLLIEQREPQWWS